MKCKKIAALIAMAALLAVPCKMASAASVSFSNFTYTTDANNEYWTKIVSKVKADNEQTWYATLTSQTGLSATVDRAMFASGRSTSNSINSDSQPVPLYSSTTRIQGGYIPFLGKGTRCWLFITGDQNNKQSYKVKVSGRYTS